MEPIYILLFLLGVITLSFVVGTIFIIKYIINLEKYYNTPDKYLPNFIKTIDDDHIINVDEIEYISHKYNRETEEFEIIIYMKSGNFIKESYNSSELPLTKERFNDIYDILNGLG